jgi:hypothetical protein
MGSERIAALAWLLACLEIRKVATARWDMRPWESAQQEALYDAIRAELVTTYMGILFPDRTTWAEESIDSAIQLFYGAWKTAFDHPATTGLLHDRERLRDHWESVALSVIQEWSKARGIPWQAVDAARRQATRTIPHAYSGTSPESNTT